jgi:hypothetical protein
LSGNAARAALAGFAFRNTRRCKSLAGSAAANDAAGTTATILWDCLGSLIFHDAELTGIKELKQCARIH